MDINRLGSLAATSDYRQVSQRSAETLEKLGSGVRAARASDDPVLWNDVEQLKASAGRFQAYSENLARAGSSVRIALGSMRTSDAQLKEMGQVLRTAREAPEGSEARRLALVRFNELHALTDGLSAPKDLGARKLLDDPARFAAAGDLNVAAGDGGFEIRLRQQSIHLGADGLDLPLAGGTQPSDPAAGPVIADVAAASDEGIDRMVDLLGRSRALLAERMAGLTADVAMVEQSEAFNERAQARSEGMTAELETANLEAEAVLLQSLSLRSNLALSGLSGFNDTTKMILQLIR